MTPATRTETPGCEFLANLRRECAGASAARNQFSSKRSRSRMKFMELGKPLMRHFF